MELPSCRFKQFFLSPAAITAHYQNDTLRPTYWRTSADSSGLFCAGINLSDTAKPLLLFIHGSPGAWYGYLPQFDDSILRHHFRMVSIDRPGFGNSRQTGVLSIQDQALLIGQVIESISPNHTVYVVGRSYGSPVAAQLALNYPTRIKGLVLVSSAVDPDKEKYFAMAFLIKRGSPLRGLLPWPMLQAQSEKERHQNDLKQTAQIWSQLTQPTVILQDMDDKIVYPSNGDYLNNQLIRAPHVYWKLKGNGHLITYHNPKVVTDGLLWLLNTKN